MNEEAGIARRRQGRIARILAEPACLAVFAFLFVYFVVVILPREASKASAYTPEGAAFDTSFFYTPAQALERAAAYSTEERFAYISARWSFDLAWPAVYGLFSLSAWAFSLRRLGTAEARHCVLAVPALGPVFDYAENIAATMLLASLPGHPLGWAVAASVSTLLKWLFVVAGIGGALLLPTAVGLRATFRIARGR